MKEKICNILIHTLTHLWEAISSTTTKDITINMSVVLKIVQHLQENVANLYFDQLLTITYQHNATVINNAL